MQTFELLEQKIGKWTGFDPANVVCCSSGTAALHLAFEALQLPLGSEVIVPDFSIVACARSVTLAGHLPVFVDCSPTDLNMDWFKVGQAITPKTKAVLVVHTYGRAASVPEDTVRRYGISVVEDLAEAHGVKPHRDSSAACWSFYQNKVVCGQEGGAVAFKDRSKADLARMLRSLGFTPEHDFWHVPRGMNYRLSNANAQLVLDSLSHFEENLQKRRWLEERCFGQTPDEWRMPPRNSPWCYDIRIPGLTSEKQTEIVKALNAQGIPARHAFKPLRRQPEYVSNVVKDKRRTFWDKPLVEQDKQETNADRAAREVFYLPLDPKVVTEEMVEKSFKVIKKVIG